MKLFKRLFSNRSKIPLQQSEASLFEPDTDRMVTTAPKILWIELTSKCPFKCVFCTREVRWGAGRNLDFAIFRSVIEQLEQPEFIGLNYSGESIHYPRLLEAIALATATGAYTELVTALSSAPQALVHQIVESDLSRLAVSIHTMDEEQYRDIYGFGSLQGLKSRIDDVVRLKRKLHKNTPKLDLCFVAMSQNVEQLLPVTRFAADVGASEIFIHPIIGRHPVPYDFSRELESNKLTVEFKESLRTAIAKTRAAFPELPLTVLNPDLDLNPVPQTLPAYYAPPLPAGGRIHTCDQSPFESVHILANGDVVVCEVHDEIALGNLHEQKLKEIWHGASYRGFRERYVTGGNPACRECVWKTAYKAEPWKAQIRASDGFSPQLTRGWWVEAGAAAIWSKKRGIAELRADLPAKRVRITGILPHDPVTHSNELLITADGNTVASVTNRTSQFLHFDRTLPLRVPACRRVTLDFATTHPFRPCAHSESPDCRDLGFALQRLELQ